MGKCLTICPQKKDSAMKTFPILGRREEGAVEKEIGLGSYIGTNKFFVYSDRTLSIDMLRTTFFKTFPQYENRTNPQYKLGLMG